MYVNLPGGRQTFFILFNLMAFSFVEIWNDLSFFTGIHLFGISSFGKNRNKQNLWKNKIGKYEKEFINREIQLFSKQVMLVCLPKIP